MHETPDLDVDARSGGSAAPEPDYGARELNPYRLDAIVQHAGRSVLDVGCGNGAYVLRLAGRYDIKGIDRREFAAWAQAPELFGISDATTLTMPDDSVDTLLSFETLEHLTDPANALGEYYRVARKNLIVTVPNCKLTPGFAASNLLYSHWSDRTHVNFFDMVSIARLVEGAGFRIAASRYINRINLGAAVAEALGLSGRPARIGGRLFRAFQRRQYFMTCLIVGEKPPKAL